MDEILRSTSDRMTFDDTRIAGLTVIGNSVNKIQPATVCIVINNTNSQNNWYKVNLLYNNK